MASEHVQPVLRWFEEVWNQRRDATIDELLCADSVCHGEGGPMRGERDFRERQYHPFLAAFPDLRVTVEGVLSDGPEVVVRWSATGTHSGDGLGARPTGKAVHFRGITWVRTEGGKMMEAWQSSNIPDVLRSLQS